MSSDGTTPEKTGGWEWIARTGSTEVAERLYSAGTRATMFLRLRHWWVRRKLRKSRDDLAWLLKHRAERPKEVDEILPFVRAAIATLETDERQIAERRKAVR